MWGDVFISELLKNAINELKLRDCKLRINLENFDHTKKVDKLLSELRTFCVELQEAKGTPDILQEYDDYGRVQILPYLKEQSFFELYCILKQKYYVGAYRKVRSLLFSKRSGEAFFQQLDQLV